MLEPGRMLLNEAEEAAIDTLIEEHGGEAVQSFTRTEPGESGPLHVSISREGSLENDVYEVAEDGTTVKLDG